MAADDCAGGGLFDRDRIVVAAVELALPERAFGAVDGEEAAAHAFAHTVAGAAAGDVDLADGAALELEDDDVAVVVGEDGDAELVAVGVDFGDGRFDGPEDQVERVAAAAEEDVLRVLFVDAPGRVVLALGA